MLIGNKRSEVKNINSFKEVERALRHEIIRQKNAIKRGKVLIQETRHWDDKMRITQSLRSKEVEEDYRYFPEQDLVPIEVDNAFIEQVKSNLPEMPTERALRLRREYMLSEFDSENLVLDKLIADFYETGANADPTFGSKEYKQYCNWLMNNISGWLNENNLTIDQTKLTPKHIGDLIKYIREGKITSKIAKSFVEDVMQGKSVSQIIKERGRTRLSDENIIKKMCKDVIEENPLVVKDLLKNPKALEALIGRVMAKTKGQADPKITREIMSNLLKNM